MKPQGLTYNELFGYWMTVVNTDNKVYLSVTPLGRRAGVNPVIMDHRAILTKTTLTLMVQDGKKYCRQARDMIPHFERRTYRFADSPTHGVFDDSKEASQYQRNVALRRVELEY